MIYFVQNPENRRLKIGYTVTATVTRVATLMVGAGCPLQVLAQAPGCPNMEATIQAAFAHLRYFGEWYVYRQPLPKFVRAVRKAFPDSQDRYAVHKGEPRRLRLETAAKLVKANPDTVLGWVAGGFLPAVDETTFFRLGETPGRYTMRICPNQLRVVAILQSLGISQPWTKGKTGFGAPMTKAERMARDGIEPGLQ